MHVHDTSGRFAEQDFEARFWRHVVKTDGCWESTSVRKSTGYGQIQVRREDGSFVSDDMHRVSWRLHRGPIPKGLYVLHHCDNRPCVRPDHLFLGTLNDNHADMVAKGRHPHGESHGQVRLTADQVLAIRARYAAGGVGTKKLAAEYGVGRATIRHILDRTTWRDL
jgi:hypothetical protein